MPAMEKQKISWPAPTAYSVKDPKNMTYSFGARFYEKRDPMFKKENGQRFDSQIRSKHHLQPRKVDGPGPGSH